MWTINSTMQWLQTLYLANVIAFAACSAIGIRVEEEILHDYRIVGGVEIDIEEAPWHFFAIWSWSSMWWINYWESMDFDSSTLHRVNMKFLKFIQIYDHSFFQRKNNWIVEYSCWYCNSCKRWNDIQITLMKFNRFHCQNPQKNLLKELAV